MGWGVRRTYRRVVGAFALAGIAFYALLLPWHLTSQLAQQLYALEFGDAASVICGNALAATDPESPGAPASSCPICKGLAAFQLAVTPAAAVVAPPVRKSVRLDPLVADHVAGASLPTPRSRGPPLPA
jgi:Protein of unknown function (DUF2946)